MPFVPLVTKRYLKIKHQRKLVSLITVLATLGVAVGVMVLVIVIAVMTGFQSELKKRILGIDAHMLIMRYSGWVENHQEVLRDIESVRSVKNAAPFVFGQGMLRTAGGVSGLLLRGIDTNKTKIQVNTLDGRPFAQKLSSTGNSNEIGIVLGAVLSEKLNLSVGDGAMLMVVGGRQTNSRQLPRMHRLKVVGLYETGMHQYDSTIGYVNMPHLQKMVGVGDLVTGFEVRVEDPDNVEAISESIISKLGFQYWANHWKQSNQNLFSMLSLQKVLMYIILTLIIIVAAFNVASALIMMVKEKTKDIAIMKTMGATNNSLKRIFLYKGLIIGGVGISIGVLAGLTVCLLLARYQFIDLPGDVYFLDTLPVELNLIDLGAIILGTLVVCTLASFYPAKQAAKMNPVDAIRFG